MIPLLLLGSADNERSDIIAGGVVVLGVGSIAGRERARHPATAINALLARLENLVVDDLGRVEVNEAIDLSRTLNVIGHGKGRVASGMEGEGSESRSRSKEGEGEDSDGLHDDIGVK